MSLSIKIKRTSQDPNWPVPLRHSAGASGFDLAADIDQMITIEPGKSAFIPTGWSFDIPEGYEGQVRPRSGIALKYGITLINSPGTIDSDYRGEVKLPVINHGSAPYTIQRGERLAQIIFCPCATPELVVIEDLSTTDSGEGGFGSTGESVDNKETTEENADSPPILRTSKK
jgi:dUTP pyrophosphatase